MHCRLPAKACSHISPCIPVVKVAIVPSGYLHCHRSKLKSGKTCSPDIVGETRAREDVHAVLGFVHCRFSARRGLGRHALMSRSHEQQVSSIRMGRDCAGFGLVYWLPWLVRSQSCSLHLLRKYNPSSKLRNHW